MFKSNNNDIKNKKKRNLSILYENSENSELNSEQIIEFLIDNRKIKFDKIQNHSNQIL